MWDFSWAVRRFGAENEYSDWDRVLDESLSRGYDCLRIEALPHLIGQPNSKMETQFTVLPYPKGFMWGATVPVTITPAQNLVDFVRKAKERGIWIALSTWLIDDSQNMKRELKSPEHFAEIWKKTLTLLKNEDLLDAVAWVDICNEFPMAYWAPEANNYVFGYSLPYSMTMSALILDVFRWRDSCVERFGEFMRTAIGSLKREFPDLNYTFSFQSNGLKNLFRADLSELDVIDSHFWISDDLLWSLLSGHSKSATNFSKGDLVLKEARSYVTKNKRKSLDILRSKCEVWKQLAKDKNLPLVTSEGWIATFLNEGPTTIADDWNWFKDISADAVQIACSYGWHGICTSSFSQPHFKKLWSDESWHINLNKEIHRSRR